MKTQIFTDGLEGAAELIKQGALVAVPTETVYGLAGNGLDESAVREIYEVKGRPAIKPLSLMVHGAQQMEEYCEDVPQGAKLLAASSGPARKAAVAPNRLDSASTPPCDEARVSGVTVELNRADPATFTNDHPRPSRISETTIQPMSSGHTAPTASDATKITMPVHIARRCP